jgi:hypothetical protein
MTSDTPKQCPVTLHLKKGDYRPPPPGALRAPCPILNTLSNHGLIPRDGRNIRADELKSALSVIGLGVDVRNFLVRGAFAEHSDNPKAGSKGTRTGLRDPNQVDSETIPVLNLDQAGRPHALEHDVSITRQDRKLGDCINLQPNLLAQFLRCSANGRSFSITDMSNLRKMRYEQQKQANTELDFPPAIHRITSGEVALLQGLFGRGMSYSIPKEYVQAVFGEERLPYKEGWTPRVTGLYFPEFAVLWKLIFDKSWPYPGSRPWLF